MNASRSKPAAAEALAAPPRVFLAPSLIPIWLTFFFLIILPLAATFFREEAFFAGAVVFLELSRLVFKVGVFRVFFFARAALALAEEAGVFFAAFLIPGLEVEAFLTPAWAAFLEAAEFGGAILLTSDLFA